MDETIGSTQKDPQSLEREIDETRAHMDRTLSALGEKLSPGKLFDQTISYFRAHGGEMAEGVGRFAKQHPLPTAMVGLGVALILLTPKSTGDFEPKRYGSRRDDDDLEDAADEYTGNRHIGKAGAEAMEGNLTEGVSSVAHRAIDRAQAQTEPLRRGLRAMAREQPLLLASLGLALGAAIGAFLPESEPERRWLGPARDRALSKLKEEGEQAYEQVRGATQRAVEDVKQAVWDVTTGRKN